MDVASLPIGLVATCLAERLTIGNVIYVAADEQRSAAAARILAALAPDAAVHHFPPSDALPGDMAPASPANSGRRIAVLHAVRMRSNQRVALVTSVDAASQRYPPPAAFDDEPIVFGTGGSYDGDEVAEQLRGAGYIDNERVDEPATLAIRGRTIDVFPADAPQPLRLEIDDGVLRSIRAFDPLTQLTTDLIDRAELHPVAEPALGADAVTLFDHLPDAAVAIDAEVAARHDRLRALVADIARSQPAVLARFIDAPTWQRMVTQRESIALDGAGARAMPRFVEQRAPLRALSAALRAASEGGSRLVVFGAPRDLRFIGGRIERATGFTASPVTSWIEMRAAPPSTVSLIDAVIDRGWQEDDLFALAAADVLGERADNGQTGPSAAPTLSVAAEIRVGDVVVHDQFGLARVAGLEPLAGADDGGEAVVLEFAGGARRQVPAADADLIWRYGGEAGAVALDKLDGSSWLSRREEVEAALAATAETLTATAAERAQRTCPPMAPDTAAYERFASGFGWTETYDQVRAIAAVRADLASGRPVERLVVGDVGYGKTEVALRAAALAALAGRQVVVAAPTTVLVRQHLEVFRARLAHTDVGVAGLSRLSSAAERKAVKSGLADGSIGIVVGTAAVAAKGIAYRDLGLIVIDEEQRFGAADKARLRRLNENAHVLTLTATPIPRTLQSALIGLQQISVIATPPARRQPIRTATGSFVANDVRAALLREKARGGQSFVVVPRIDDMAAMRDTLTRLVPELTFREAHGKMAAAEIDAAMIEFARGEGDVLLATNIIEAGLDVPRANTMIVWRADRFGLAQLHQLRGRVGRGARRGHVLLLTPPDRPLTDATRHRLHTLETYDRLGAGFEISARDLDVRGAGDLLGDAQAGHVKLIGVDLYQHLLHDALKAARGEMVDRSRCDMHLGIAGRLPSDWIPDDDIRLDLYVRLARLSSAEEIDAFEHEIEDRFGALPPEVATILAVARIGVLAREAGIARIDAGPAAIAVTPRPDCTATLAGFTEKDDRLILAERIDDPSKRAERLYAILEELTS